MASSQSLKRKGPKQDREFARNHNKNDTSLYSLNTVNALDWELFMWFASLETVENYICLFIVIWDAIPVRNNAEFSKELREETNNVIQIIKKLNIFDKNYSKMLDDYKNYRFLNNQSFRQNLVHDVWVELESCGLKNNSYAVSNQLERCSFFQKRELRAMVLTRIKSFQSFSRKINEVNEFQQAPLNNKVKDENLEILLRENENLKDQIVILSEKNLQIGSTTIIDDEINSKKQLIDDITELQDTLSDFTMVQGSDYKVIDEHAASLLKTWKCNVEYPSARANVVLGALLQHLVITTILKEVQHYLQYSRSSGDIDPTLESDMVNAGESIIKYAKLFNDKRKGENEITKITPIIIRQHVYSALSHRGFFDKHPLIKEIADKLLIEMNKYRQVVDKETNDEINDQVIQITRKVIDIFCFRLKAQAVEPTFQFFDAGQAVDARFMQGAFGRDEVRKLEVEACGFPCIGIFDDDKSVQKVYTKAQIIARPKTKNTNHRYIVYSMNTSTHTLSESGLRFDNKGPNGI